MKENKKTQNKLVIIVGPSGSGKTTIANQLFPPECRVLSFTTRDPRPNELDGRDYYFIKKERALELIKDKAVIESIEYNNHYYGYTKDELKEKLKRGNCVAIATIEGYNAFKESELGELVYPVFLKTTLEKLQENFKTREESSEEKAKRLEFFSKEAANERFFDAESIVPVDCPLVEAVARVKANLERRL